MIKILFVLMICGILSYPSESPASENINGPDALLHEFLHAEFVSNASFRVGHVINSPERQALIKEKYKPMIGEMFVWESERLCAVNQYAIANIKVIGSKAKAEVLFDEFACTGSNGYGKEPLIRTDRNSLVKYCLEYKEGKWWIKDPPIPRVSTKALIDYNNQIIERMATIMQNGTEAQKQYYYNLISANEVLREVKENTGELRK